MPMILPLSCLTRHMWLVELYSNLTPSQHHWVSG